MAMWIPFLIALLAEFFDKSTTFPKFLVKVIGAGFIGLIINTLLAIFIPSVSAYVMPGLLPAIALPTLNLTTILTFTFIIAPFIAALIGWLIVFSARYLGVIKI